MLSLISDEVITWGYNPGVVGVIDAELSELWGYKVIPRVDGVITCNPNNPGVITPGLSELLTRSYRSYNPGLLELQGYNSDNSASITPTTPGL